MRLVIFSDVHGNLEALEAVLQRCESENIDRVICLGDVVGYGADPNACIKKVRQFSDIVIAGNHDWAAVGLEDSSFFNQVALEAIQWTGSQLTSRHVDYLKSCPISNQADGALFVHASPYQPDAWHYISTAEDAREGLSYTDSDVVFVGHTHRAFIFREKNGKSTVNEGRLKIKPSERYLVNVGSVGQPRDGDARAAFVVWDQEASELELCRVAYDVAAAQAKIRKALLPDFLAERLSYGS